MLLSLAARGAEVPAPMIALPGVSQPTGSELSRAGESNILERAVEAWDSVSDCMVDIRQTQRAAGGRTRTLWALATLVKGASPASVNQSAFLIEFYGRPAGAFAPAGGGIPAATPERVYFSDAGRKLYTYDPAKNAVTIEWLNEESPLPEFMQLAGFLEFDLETLRERAYVDADVYEEYIDGIPVYRIHVVPRARVRGDEPPRLLWVNRDTFMPVRFGVVSDIELAVDFRNYRFNRGLRADALEPEVRRDTTVVDLTR